MWVTEHTAVVVVSAARNLSIEFITKRSQADKQTQSSVAEIQDICVRNIMEPGVHDLLFSLNLGCLSYMLGAKLCKLTQTTRKQKSNTICQNISKTMKFQDMLHVSHTIQRAAKSAPLCSLGSHCHKGTPAVGIPKEWLAAVPSIHLWEKWVHIMGASWIILYVEASK